MQVFRAASRLPTRAYRRRPNAVRLLSTAPSSSPSSSSNSNRPVPWFVDAEAERSHDLRPNPPHLPSKEVLATVPPIPENVPEVVKNLHAELVKSPHLEPSELLVREPPEIPPGPPLPPKGPQGRRKRGSTYAGEGVLYPTSGIWNWLILAQVKEGTEKRGAIESVVRLVRKTLLKMEPPLPLPPNAKRKVNDTWAMIDAGDFAVHIMSKSAKEKFFTRMEEW
ncbi:hypothetical protein GLOTRDRAFT_73135 [Gloeophyllum trabeum ATCC 11539]|uniref:Uncharacterized protein n=1 Tax=Gloeophyllum trabeum (strain ATCC 11539 / FP-39264 / Madison 617) TaxID=670483 RepID=S7RYW7_GLOTA|nr:uncharacterized protein GLOTRDRAFT_73135 [Gloeophyllum trabeum ATCC 11539]EPQ58614.1 hypothetical protein GLOTRDRAFT_73135 [Gloeophyllum trabeum ATCC 11539]